MKTFITFFILLISSSVSAEIRSFGHNQSHTNYVLQKENTCTFGLQIIGCGGDDIFVGISPFLYAFYNMHNFYLRYNLHNSSKTADSLEIAYFETFNDDTIPERTTSVFDAIFKMKSVWAYYIYTYKFTPDYKLHLNTNISYYFDDERPFSLRRPTIKRDPYQFNFTTLHEIRLSKRFDMLGEFGVLHIHDEFPRIHMGSSFLYRNGNFSMQLGFTFTATLSSLIINAENPLRRDLQQLLIYDVDGYNDPLASEKTQVRQDFAIHPEVAIQYEF